MLKRLLLHPERWCPAQRIHYRDYSHTYAEFAERVARLGHLLRRLGVQPGDAVGVLDWDSHRYHELSFAVPMCGAVLPEGARDDRRTNRVHHPPPNRAPAPRLDAT